MTQFTNFLDKYKDQREEQIRIAATGSLAKPGEVSKTKDVGHDLWARLKSDKVMRFNFLIMLYAWCATSVSFYINGLMLKYVKGDMFVNVAVSIMAEFISLVIAGAISVNFGIKLSIVLAYSCAFAGALLLFVFQSAESLIPVFLVLLRFGLGSSFGLIYLANFIFPVEYAAQTLGFCNTLARFMTVASPILVEMDQTIYLLFLCTVTLGGAILMSFLKINKRLGAA